MINKFILNNFLNFNKKENKPYLELLLSVSVGTQLGDVFLHLLPEAFSHPEASTINIGLWTLIGLFLFFIIEKIFPENQQDFSYEKFNQTEISLVFYNKINITKINHIQ